MPNDKKPSDMTPIIERHGNADAKILYKAYEAYAANGLTTGERQRIKKLDDILKGADISISPDGLHANIAQAGEVFQVRSESHSKTPIGPMSSTIYIDMVEREGNADAKILDAVYKEFSEGGLTAEKRKKIEEIGKILKNANIIISDDGRNATIIQSDGMTFTKDDVSEFGIQTFGFNKGNGKGK